MTKENCESLIASLSRDYKPEREYTTSQIASIEGVSWKTVIRWKDLGVKVENETICLLMAKKKKNWYALGKWVVEFKKKRNGL